MWFTSSSTSALPFHQQPPRQCQVFQEQHLQPNHHHQQHQQHLQPQQPQHQQLLFFTSSATKEQIALSMWHSSWTSCSPMELTSLMCFKNWTDLQQFNKKCGALSFQTLFVSLSFFSPQNKTKQTGPVCKHHKTFWHSHTSHQAYWQNWNPSGRNFNPSGRKCSHSGRKWNHSGRKWNHLWKTFNPSGRKCSHSGRKWNHSWKTCSSGGKTSMKWDSTHFYSQKINKIKQKDPFPGLFCPAVILIGFICVWNSH